MKTIEKELFDKFVEDNMYASKNLGQNFLKNEKVLEDIGNFCIRNKVKKVIEIGGGVGAMTSFLCRSGLEVKVYEIDKKYARLLRELEKKYTGLEVFEKDFLKTSYDVIDRDVSVIANIPYNITSDIIERIYSCDNIPESSLLMVQKEFAKRIVRKENISVLNSFLSVFCDVNIERYVSRNDFFPRPKVDSALIGIISLDESSREERTGFLSFLKKMYSSKRKKISRSLKMHFGVKKTFGSSEKRIEAITPLELFDLYLFVKGS